MDYGAAAAASTGTNGPAPSFCSTRSTEQLQWSIMESDTLTAHTAALLGGAHTAEQVFKRACTAAPHEQIDRAAASQSTQSSSAGACGEGTHSWLQIQQLHWSTWSSGSLGADRVSK